MSSPTTYVAPRWRRRASSLTCYPRPCSPDRVRALRYPRHHRPHARRHASAGGGRAASAATVHHDGREDAIRDQRALYREGPHARQRRRRAPVAERARQVNGEYIAKARTLDHEHSRQADGTRYPGVREQVQGHLVGPVLAALRAWVLGPGRC